MSFGHEYGDAYTVEETREFELEMCQRALAHPPYDCCHYGPPEETKYCCWFYDMAYDESGQLIYSYCKLINKQISNPKRVECTEFDFHRRILEVL